MGKQARPRPRCLARKLLTIRERLCFSQSEMIRLLGFQMTTARISEYELGTREPNLLVLLAYARVGDVSVDKLIDDELSI